ncbi:hypothetical protein DWB68_03400 [Galactobacter valiniphilus]|uniref:Uncharacterized protein n=1 Tax=Galactobacter valiniphilus TaxID=2676122 RepID=A0A399JBZ4_9MICC|nr:hypothetical protein [Galactobacter valiniphilus]RII43091.1 hypothetical protein DWB68_03400 [Galactobacter valiniphilus]
MPEIRGTFIFDAGLTPGMRDDGSLSHLVFDSSGNLRAHASFVPDDVESEDSYSDPSWSTPPEAEEVRELQEADFQAAAAMLLVAAGLVVGAAVGVQHLWKRWRVPLAKRVRSVFRRRSAPDSNSAHDEVEVYELAPVITAAELVIAPQHRSMSEEEAAHRLAMLMAAAAFAAQQYRALADAEIQSQAVQEFLTLLPHLTSQQATDRLNVALAAGDHVLDARARLGLEQLFLGGYQADGSFRPVERERVREVLSSERPGQAG